MTSLHFPPPADDIGAATVVRWLKRAGDSFAAGDPLVELEAERALVVVEAAAPGRLTAFVAAPGTTVAVGAKLAEVKLAGAPVADVASEPTAEKNVSPDAASNRTGGPVIPILMPQAGNTMEEGTVVSWRVSEGEQIAVGQILCEIETDKATMDFESPDAGRLARIVAQVGEPVPVKELIAVLADSDADADAFLADRGADATVATVSDHAVATTTAPLATIAAAGSRSDAPAVVTTSGRVKASPAARNIAAERGVALAAVGAGSGPGGRILSTDVLNAQISTPAVGNSQAAAGRRIPLSKMRRAIGVNLQRSKQTIPHFYVRLSIDADPLMAFYAERKAAVGCTLNDLVVLAVGRAIREFPAVRSQFAGDELVEFPHANIGIAVGVEDGLVVPVVLAVDTLSLAQLAAETKRVVENSRKGKLENIGKGIFTISNLGMFGVEEFSAIINPPESGILAVSAVRETVVVENGAMRAGRVMTMTLSTDHRVVDGVLAAKFMARLKAILEHPADELA